MKTFDNDNRHTIAEHAADWRNSPNAAAEDRIELEALREEVAMLRAQVDRLQRFVEAVNGAAEETLISLRARQPVFLIGGFGGCNRDVVDALDLVEPWAGSRNSWAEHGEFEQWTGA